MTVVVLAPNAYKGTIGPLAAAEALAAGWARVRPADEVRLVPMADGGDGTLEALGAAGPVTVERAPVPGPVGGVLEARWLRNVHGTAMLELASTGGFSWLADSRLPPRRRAADAGTAGLGTAVRIALQRGAEELILAVGGSASTDGGAGFLTALGARLLDRAGEPIPGGNAGLAALHRVDLSRLTPPPPRGAVVLSDVTNPLLGPRGAATVFGPQKGAAPEDVPVLEANLAHLAARLAEVTPIEPDRAGAGAAGGLGFGAVVWGARIVDGAAEIANRVGLPAALTGADLVITGEGRFDDQTEGGKAPARVHALAAAAGVPALLVAGRIDAPLHGWADAVALDGLAPDAAAAMREPARWLTEAAATLAARLPA